MPNMNLIVPGVWLGNAFAARNVQSLHEHAITHILSVLQDNQPQDDGFTRLTIAVDDADDEDLLSRFHETNTFIQSALEDDGAVLVHCQQGVSRSATVVAAYMMQTHSLPPSEAVRFLRSKRFIVWPNPGFFTQLEIYSRCNCDISSKEGQVAYQGWKKERDVRYAELVKRTENFQVLWNHRKPHQSISGPSEPSSVEM
ncbi:hypothetical protein JAAARDRAFT_41203 [Jaapia argillacea MUCL 33604]|uniref:Uncharacterized protein n=1 Tax=Jaapia argillacea MUCL 33604 TaxID=933084 RepID=A0A067P9A5_9AGAM|nr:hypothetical protein JAAARDRAFT_41203 [Jaapia argillacea MUCL 33604]